MDNNLRQNNDLDRPIVLYVPKSRGVILAEYPNIATLSRTEGGGGITLKLIREAMDRKGTYLSKIHKQRAAPRYKTLANGKK